MSRYDPIDKSMVRMELRRFQTRCEAQEGTLRRADTIHEVVRLATIAIPFSLSEETAALDARRQLKQVAEARACELFESLLDRMVKAEPFAREKIRRTLEDDILQFNGGLNHLRTWASARKAATEQTLTD